MYVTVRNLFSFLLNPHSYMKCLLPESSYLLQYCKDISVKFGVEAIWIPKLGSLVHLHEKIFAAD